MAMTTVSSKYQIVIPKAVRKAASLRPGTKLSVIALGNDQIVLKPLNGTHVDRLRGLGKEVRRALGGGEKYLENERNSWDK